MFNNVLLADQQYFKHITTKSAFFSYSLEHVLLFREHFIIRKHHCMRYINTIKHTGQQSAQPVSIPTFSTYFPPSRQPSSQPSSQPACQPSHHPTSQPTSQRSCSPTSQPTSQPLSQPSSTD